ncbi:MAG TPA: hypothetical protein VJB06_00140, partial [archaeon]|nr:hypothetical protein [archaeon]
KARDFYDIWHMLFNKHIPADFELIDRKISKLHGKRFDLKEFFKNMESVKSSWKIDIFRLLPTSSKIEYSLIEKYLRGVLVG